MNNNHSQTPAGAPPPDNVVQLTNKICEEGPTAAAELEKKRHIAMRAFQITAIQLDADALSMEQTAIVGEHTIQRRHEIMDMARALRIAQTWLVNLVGNGGGQPEVKP